MKTTRAKTKRSIASSAEQTPLAALASVFANKAKSLSKVQKALEKCVVTTADKGPVVDPYRLSRVLKETKTEATTLLPEVASLFPSVHEWAAAQMESVHQSIELRLRELCSAAGLSLAGHFPSYFIADLIPVQVKESANPQVIVDGDAFPTLLVDAVFPAIQAAVAEERARKYDHKEFVRLLEQAYDQTVRLEGKKPGEHVPIRALYRQLLWLRQTDAFFGSGRKDKFTDYPLKWFARDLGRMAAEGMAGAASERRVVLAPTSFHAEGVLVRQGSEAQIVGNVALT